MKLLVTTLASLSLIVSVGCGGDGGTTTDTSADTSQTTPDTSSPDDTSVPDSATADDSDTPDVAPPTCAIPEGTVTPEATEFLQDLDCQSDFEALASEPLDASIPGARSLKTVYDKIGGAQLYFQNVELYPVHYAFASTHLSGGGKPPVGDLGTFNATEYYSPARRFLLGAITYYTGPNVWVYEISPYDTASAAMIETAFDAIREHAFFGGELKFHPTSESVTAVAAQLPSDIPIITTDELFAGMTFQPLNLAVGTGKLRFIHSAELADATLSFRDIVVLDYVPNDIAVVAGIITEQLQTPLSHINVLSQNRKTPNMGLLGAFTNETLRALEDKWVEITVGAFDWQIHEITQDEADAWWEAHRPPSVQVPRLDLTKTSVVSIDDVLPAQTDDLGQAIDDAIPAFGGKATHYSAIRRIGSKVRVEPALGVPVYFYDQFMKENDLYSEAAAMIAEPDFKGDAKLRQERLAAFQAKIIAAPINQDFMTALLAAIETLPRQRVRFRSSTNAEDLDGFTGAGLYVSATGDPYDHDDPVDVAVKTVWASVWRYKAFEEREYRGISHDNVGMALLVSPSFSNERCNGVAITNNLFSADGSEPGMVVNVQKGDISIVLPPQGVSSDYFIYYWYYPGQPWTYLSHSSLVNPDTTVMTRSQAYQLGVAMDAIQTFFRPIYEHTGSFYGMDIEFKVDQPDGEEPQVFIKQARPHPGWGLE